MKMFKLTLLATAIAALAGCNSSDKDDDKVSIVPKDTASKEWYTAAQAEVTEAKSVADAVNNAKGSAKNIILFVGDGMGISTVTASRILQGQMNNEDGEDHMLSYDQFPFSGLAKTYNTNQQTPDSAGTMTAMMTGVKTKAGIISVSEAANRSDCVSSQDQGLVTALELAEIAGKSTGIVSTARITHATPAATYAKSPERNWEDNSDMTQEAIDAGCEDIASQLIGLESSLETRFNNSVDSPVIDGIDVVMGGGRRHFLPKDAAFNTPDADSSVEGDRTDSRNLITEWQAQYTNGTYVYDQAGFDAIPSSATKVLGLFSESHMRYEADRANDVSGEPSLSEMTAKAIEVLDNNDDGYFLMVESGRIDHGHHAGSAYNALTDAVEFANAVQAAVDSTDADDTLIIVTADHSHVFTIAGYPTRGNPILGKVITNDSNGAPLTEVALAADDMPYTTLTYTNGPGFHDLGDDVTDADAIYNETPVSGRADLTNVDTTSSGFHQEALVPMSSETHAGEDVGVFARGPGAQLVTGTHEQNYLFHVMNHAGNLLESAEGNL
jgi:alkaline phosphatase